MRSPTMNQKGVSPCRKARKKSPAVVRAIPTEATILALTVERDPYFLVLLRALYAMLSSDQAEDNTRVFSFQGKFVGTG